MAEYRNRTCPESIQGEPAPVAPIKKFGLSQLADHYGVWDMMDFSSSDASAERMIDEEFLAYTTANFEHTDIRDNDILAFWEVSILTTILRASTKVIPNRQMKPGFRHYSALHSTTSLSRLQQFHVSRCSLQVGKPTQSDAIESIPCLWKHFRCLSFL